MPKFLEQKLKREYGADSAVPYKVMNAIGAMRGNKETAKGRAMEAKHARVLHPKLAAHGQKVKAAHAHLSRTQPGFRSQPMRHQMSQVQAHIRKGQ